MAGLRSHSSGLIYDDSTGSADQEETSSLDSVEWTNEKHSMYINSMEASFIDQLYNSKDLFNLCAPEDRGLDVKLCNQGNPPGQFHQHGYGAFLANPYSHYRATDDDAFEGNISRMLVDEEHHRVSASFNEEVSDQNFLNEDYENRAVKRAKRAKRPKRTRTIDASTTSNNDQVVPQGISHFSMQDHRYVGSRN